MTEYRRYEHPLIDDSRRPLYVLKVEAIVPSVEEVEVFQGHQDAFFSGLEHDIVWITDMRNSIGLPAAQRKVYSDGQKRRSITYKQHIRAVGIICSGAIHQGIVTALFWFSKLPCPYKIVTSMEEAERFCAAELANIIDGENASTDTPNGSSDTLSWR